MMSSMDTFRPRLPKNTFQLSPQICYYSRASQYWPCWHLGGQHLISLPDESSCALWDANQHPWPAPTRCWWQPSHPQGWLKNVPRHYQMTQCAQWLSCVQLFASPWTVGLPGSSVHGISQAGILEWVAISFSRGSSQPRNPTCLLHWQADPLPLSHQGSPKSILLSLNIPNGIGISTMRCYLINQNKNTYVSSRY